MSTLDSPFRPRQRYPSYNRFFSDALLSLLQGYLLHAQDIGVILQACLTFADPNTYAVSSYSYATGSHGLEGKLVEKLKITLAIDQVLV